MNITPTLEVAPLPIELTRVKSVIRSVPEQLAVMLPDAGIVGQYAVALWDGRRIRESALLSPRSAVQWAWPAGMARREIPHPRFGRAAVQPRKRQRVLCMDDARRDARACDPRIGRNAGGYAQVDRPTQPGAIRARDARPARGRAGGSHTLDAFARAGAPVGGHERDALGGPTFVPATCFGFREAMRRAAGDPAPDQPRRLYISRSKARRRRVLNESAVIALLAPLGFEAFTLEDLSVAEQVRLFAGAEAVVAPHGSGLTNLVFGQGIKVIELHTPLQVHQFVHGAQPRMRTHVCRVDGRHLRPRLRHRSRRSARPARAARPVLISAPLRHSQRPRYIGQT
ncbi:MAG: glycosyltransferase family 61 protein [Chloroflexi bacterium]|nr:glycosyltransferase family 61 protein [Chloroflexota bacterium]